MAGEGEVYRNRNLSRANNKLDLLPLSLSLSLFGVSFFRVLAKKQIQNVFSPDILCLSSAGEGRREGRGEGQPLGLVRCQVRVA